MRRIGVAGLVGALAMGFLSYVPVVGWLNLLLGLWFFVGGLVAAFVWTRMGDGTRGVFPCILASGLAGALLAGASGLYILVGVEGAARSAGQAEFLQAYPRAEMTTEEILDYWEAQRVGAQRALQAELDGLVTAGDGETAAAYRLRQHLSKLEEVRVKMGRLRTDHEREKTHGGGVVEWMAQTSHDLFSSLRDGDTSMVRVPVLLVLLIRGLFIVAVAMGGGILGALVFGEDQAPEVEASNPEPAG
jgi:hypothetical protein